MPWNVEYNQTDSIVELTFSGVVTREELQKAIIKRIAVQKENGGNLVLTDASKVDITPLAVDLLDLPNRLFAEQGADRLTRLALVMPEAEAPKSMAKFLETASYNRGWSIHLFEDRQSAFKWLKEDT